MNESLSSMDRTAPEVLKMYGNPITKQIDEIVQRKRLTSENNVNKKKRLGKIIKRKRSEKKQKVNKNGKILKNKPKKKKSNVKRGKGIINSLINHLPFEMHVPGYQYCGPGDDKFFI